MEELISMTYQLKLYTTMSRKKHSENVWRCDFNLHSEKMIKKILKKEMI